MAALVLKHGIDADDEVAPAIIASRQVPANYFFRYCQKATIGTVRAFNPGLLTDTPHPFICASWLVACPPSLPAFKTQWINILSPAEQGSKQRDLVGSRRALADASIAQGRERPCDRDFKLVRQRIRAHMGSLDRALECVERSEPAG